jgi:hypothetical protein
MPLTTNLLNTGYMFSLAPLGERAGVRGKRAKNGNIEH